MEFAIDIIRKTGYYNRRIRKMGSDQGGENVQRVNIEAERGRLQMTKEAFSRDLGITPKTYNCYINGDPIPSTILEKLKEKTGRSIDYLLGLDAGKDA